VSTHVGVAAEVLAALRTCRLHVSAGRFRLRTNSIQLPFAVLIHMARPVAVLIAILGGQSRVFCGDVAFEGGRRGKLSVASMAGVRFRHMHGGQGIIGHDQHTAFARQMNLFTSEE